MRQTPFAKGHATGNDFVIIDDHHGAWDLSPDEVQRLTDRHFGVGGDGVLRVVRAGLIEQWDGDPSLWFMDYHNADGSIAEMCGNGLRLFVRYLEQEQLAPSGEFEVATRAGVKQVRLEPDGTISVGLGPVTLAEHVTISSNGREFEGIKADVGNPHAVVWTDPQTVESLRLTEAPTWQPADAFPAGVNVEFAAETAPGEILMRVHERGSGETLSCGTGVVATAASYLASHPEAETAAVTVPGGQLQVTRQGDDFWLRGGAVITVRGEFWF